MTGGSSLPHCGSRRRADRPAGPADPDPLAGARVRRRLEPGHPLAYTRELASYWADEYD